MTGEKIMPTDNSLPGLSSGSEGGENGCSSGPSSDPNTPSASSPQESANLSTGSSGSLADEDFDLAVDGLDNGLPTLSAAVPVSSAVMNSTMDSNIIMTNAASVAIQLSQLTMLPSPFSALPAEDGVTLDNGHPQQGQLPQRSPRNQNDSTTSSSSVDSPPPSQPPAQGPLEPVGAFDMFPISPLTFPVEHAQQTPLQQRASRPSGDGHSQSFPSGFLSLSHNEQQPQQQQHGQQEPWANGAVNCYSNIMSSMEFDAMVAELNVGQPAAPFDISNYHECLGASQQQAGFNNGVVNGHNSYLANGGLVSAEGGFGAGHSLPMQQNSQTAQYNGVNSQTHSQLHAASSQTMGFLNGAPSQSANYMNTQSSGYVNGTSSQGFGYPNGASSSGTYHPQHGPNTQGYGPFSNGGGHNNHSPSFPLGQGYSSGAGTEEYQMMVMGSPADNDQHGQVTAGTKGDRDRKPNYTECVDVFTSEHVAEIVGRQGCKIKDLRQRTNTYIRTPTRQEPPIFTVTGVKEKVIAAASEIRRMRDHFTGIRDSRRSRQNNPDEECDTVEVPMHLVGLVVGPKGATVKKIQKDSGAYIVTPSRQADPIFSIRGQRHEIDSAIKMIKDYIKERTRDSQDHHGRERRTRSPRAIHGSHPPSPDPSMSSYHPHHNPNHHQASFGHVSNGSFSSASNMHAQQQQHSNNAAASSWFGSHSGAGASDSGYNAGHNGYRRSAFNNGGFSSENGSSGSNRRSASNNNNSSNNSFQSGVLPSALSAISNSFSTTSFINTFSTAAFSQGLANNASIHTNNSVNLSSPGSSSALMGAGRVGGGVKGALNTGCNGWLNGPSTNGLTGWGMTNGISNGFADSFGTGQSGGHSNGLNNGLTNGLIGNGLSGLMSNGYDTGAVRAGKNFSATPGAGRRGSDHLSRAQCFLPSPTTTANIPTNTNHHNNDASRSLGKTSGFPFTGNLLEFLDKPDQQGFLSDSRTPIPSFDLPSSDNSFFRGNSGAKFGPTGLATTTSFNTEPTSASIYTDPSAALPSSEPSAWSPSLNTSRGFAHLTAGKETQVLQRQADRQQVQSEEAAGAAVSEMMSEDGSKGEEKEGQREEEEKESEEKERSE